jgi:UDP-N-acetylglucosamine 2-epimerase
LIGSRYGSWVEVIREGYETLEILKRVDSVATISSAIVLEALMLNKECLVADYLAGRRSFGYKGYDAVHIIENEEEVAYAIRQSMFHRKPYEKKKRLLEDELYRLDGRAGERSARIIENLALQRIASAR